MCETSKNHQEFTEQNGEFDLPQHILEKYDSCQQIQLIRGYRILQVLKYYPDNEPFFEKPKNEKRGSVYYYDVIESPMWLNEIKRKFFNAEYNSLCEVIADMRLIFENCYYFWGPKSTMTELSLQMERLLENQMLLLPKDLKIACTLEETHGKIEDHVVKKVWNRCRNKGKSCSRLMLKAWRKRRISECREYNLKSDLSAFCKNSKQIMKWEKDILALYDNLSTIYSSSELPQIGLFIQLVQNSFNLMSVCQTRIERMMLMPQYSDIFQEIMSTLLNNGPCKVKLKYEKLMKEFENFVSNWYSEYENNDRDVFEVSKNTGIEKDFFEIVGDNNVLLTQKYEELPYNKKIKILKSVCDHLIHTRPVIKEIIRNADEKKFSAQRIGRDKHGYVYLFFPTFLDFRLYKQRIKDGPHVNKKNQIETDSDSDYQNTPFRRFLPSNSTRFELVADSIESVRCLIDELFYSELENTKKEAKYTNTEIIDALQKFLAQIHLKENEYIRVTNEARIKLFNEWREHSVCEKSIMEGEVSDSELITADKCNKNINVGIESSEMYANVDKKKNETDGGHDQKLDDDHSSTDSCQNKKNKKNVTKEVHDDHEFELNNENNHTSRKDEDEKNKEIEEETKNNHSDSEDEEEKNEEIEEKIKNKQNNETVNINNNETTSDSFIEEMESFIKTEPQVIEEKFEENEEKYDNFYLKSEVKDDSRNNNSSSESMITTRRRRSSVPSYNVYNEDFFSDENESISPEEMYSSEEDSDDEWEIPKKRNRNKNKSRITKQFKATLRNETFCSDGKKRKRRSSNEVNASLNCSLDNKRQVDKLKIKLENVKSEPIDSLQNECQTPPSKIKVIDLAKLKNNESQQNLNSKYNTNAFIVQSKPGVNSLSTIRTGGSQSITTFSTLQPRLMVRQPVNVYTNKNQNSPRRFINSQNMASGPSSQTIVRTVEIPTSFPNMPNLMVYRRALATKQMIRVPTNVMNKFMNNETTRKQFVTDDRSARNSGLLSKINKNITIIQKETNKSFSRRPSVREIEGTIGIHSNSGNLQYVVNLANGTHVPLSNEQVQKLREGNRGVLPQKLKIPVPTDVAEKIEPCVVIDD